MIILFTLNKLVLFYFHIIQLNDAIFYLICVILSATEDLVFAGMLRLNFRNIVSSFASSEMRFFFNIFFLRRLISI